ncbi:hypothetical protein HY485_02840 [Candidatus Woesearchaeota archaeon]|nr:hypothetical protein [Candidatus Woesearchaeota archaeon]
MNKKDYFIVEAKVKAVNGKVIHEALKDRSELELELEDNAFGVKSVDVAGMLPIEAGDLVRIGFEKSVYVGCSVFEGHIHKNRTKDDVKQEMRADIIEKIKDGKVVATYKSVFW